MCCCGHRNAATPRFYNTMPVFCYTLYCHFEMIILLYSSSAESKLSLLSLNENVRQLRSRFGRGDSHTPGEAQPNPVYGIVGQLHSPLLF